MLTSLSDLAKSAIYYGLAFGLCVLVCALYPVLGASVVLLAMYTPLAAVLLMLLVVTPEGRTKAGWASLGLHRAGLRGWLPALLIPLAVLGCAYLLAWGAGLAGFAVSAELAQIGFWMLPAAALFEIVMHLLLTGALAEEIGWRGYLLPRLVPALGPRGALSLTGLLHGMWHLPIMLLTPLYHSGANWLIVLPLFLIGSVVWGNVVGYLRLATGSVWPSALLHAAHNVFWGILRSATVASPLIAEYVIGESGVLPLTGYALVHAAIVFARTRRDRRSQPATA
ncbi:MAG: CPBP family glutamic-type intramembrane protease [Alphaproteobacteria bacterium]